MLNQSVIGVADDAVGWQFIHYILNLPEQIQTLKSLQSHASYPWLPSIVHLILVSSSFE